MKIDQDTLVVLRNFAAINPMILIREGRILKTLSASKSIFGVAEVATNFPTTFAISKLDRFLSSMSLMSDPDLEFGDKTVKISDAESWSLTYVYGDPRVKPMPPEADGLNLPPAVVKFSLNEDVLPSIAKAHAVMGLSDLAIIGDGNTVTITALDIKNSFGDTFSLVVGETQKKFRAIFRYDNLKMLPDAYDVTICEGISHFTSKSRKLQYYIALEEKSQYA
jgi:hypothetical protein